MKLISILVANGAAFIIVGAGGTVGPGGGGGGPGGFELKQLKLNKEQRGA